jgi:ribonuclease-3 family protein
MDFDGKVNNKSVNQLPPLVLAFIGDSVFDLFVRSRLVMKKRESAHKLHIKATGYVKAAAQSRIAEALYEQLSDEEKNIFRRGRNSKPATIPKNADIHDYHYATAFEAVLGYLYLLGRQERLNELLYMAAGVIELEGDNGEKKE